MYEKRSKNRIFKSNFIFEILQIPLSTNIPMGELERALQMSAEEFEQTYRIPKPHPSDPVIFFCKGGVRASEANDFARSSEHNSLSFSLSHTHTHTHTDSLSIFFPSLSLLPLSHTHTLVKMSLL